MSRFPLNEHDAYRIRKAREELAAAVDMADGRAMARKVGRLEVAVEQLLQLLDEPPTQSHQDGTGVPDGESAGGTGGLPLPGTVSGTGVTVTLATVDDGPVTLPEPSWCAGHDGHQPEHRVDLVHTGTPHVLRHGAAELWVAFLAQAPCATDPAGRGVGLYVAQQGYEHTTDRPADLYDLAASLETHADRLRDLADMLAAVLGGEAR